MALVVGALIASIGPAASADDAVSRLQVLWIDGHAVAGVARGVPAVGDGPAIRRYHDSGRFAGDRAAIAIAAQDELIYDVARECPIGPQECRGDRIAIVVDVDDTLLDWYGPYARHGFHLSGTSRQAAVQSCATRVIAPVRALVKRAEALGVSVLIVSGRRERARPATEACLGRRGIAGWSDLVLRRPAEDKLSAAVYKQRAYERFIDAGWDIVLSIGDQRGDLVGTETSGRFLLPNPLYTVR